MRIALATSAAARDREYARHAAALAAPGLVAEAPGWDDPPGFLARAARVAARLAA